jgi:hypothetical protein
MSSSGTLSPEAQRLREQLRSGGMLPGASVSVEELPKAKPVKGKSVATAGRFKTMNEFVDFSARLVDTTAQAVWLVLFRETKPNGVACVSHSQIAERIGSSRRTVVRATQHLEDAKLVTVVHRGGLTGGTSAYRVHGTPAGCDVCITPTSATSVTGGVTKPDNSA